ncbi:hypothetical protein NPIL_38931 [Nephila pilipes]|uniref:Uncharacterized protein n=1 Tax=Nephila pilipes TaxID=299642 RepID=A0A8X6PKK3_NEPPI|nr:hypothetical protein NPIL_38931 [Nephila pilipes]
MLKEETVAKRLPFAQKPSSIKGGTCRFMCQKECTDRAILSRLIRRRLRELAAFQVCAFGVEILTSQVEKNITLFFSSILSIRYFFASINDTALKVNSCICLRKRKSKQGILKTFYIKVKKKD